MHIENRANFNTESWHYHQAGSGLHDVSRQEGVLLKPRPRILWESVLGTGSKSTEMWEQVLPHLKDAVYLKISGHLLRTGEVAGEFAQYLGLGREQVDRIKLKGLLHDIGKTQKFKINDRELYVFSRIINSSHTLAMQERELMDMHSAVGAEMLRTIGMPDDFVHTVANHHYDSIIDRDTNIISIADVYDATLGKNCHRPYRKGELMERRRVFCEEGDRRFGHLTLYCKFRQWEALKTSAFYPREKGY